MWPSSSSVFEICAPKRQVFRSEKSRAPPELAPQVYGFCRDEGVSVQHILYDTSDWRRLEAWRKESVVREGQGDIICVLGAYAPPKPAALEDLKFVETLVASQTGRCMVCAFGKAEHQVLCAAAALGADVRIGFENNIHGLDGQLASNNAANVAQLHAAVTAALGEGISQ